MKNKTLKRVFKFCIGGGLGVIAGYVALYTLTAFFGLWYVASSVIASILNYAVNFTMQKFWTFENREIAAIPKQAKLYFAMSMTFLIINTGLMYALVEFMFLPYMLAQVILTVLLSVASYFITHKIFAPKTPSSSTG